jgi:hypothetical protein
MYEIGTKVVITESKKTGTVVDCLWEMDTQYEACEVLLEDGTKEWVSIDSTPSGQDRLTE